MRISSGTEKRSGLERLEPRRLLTSYVVDTTVDESDGDYSAGDLSLREAIELANETAGQDTITFDSVVIVLGLSVFRGFQITDDMVIDGGGIVLNNHERSHIFTVNGTSAEFFDIELREAEGMALKVTNDGHVYVHDASFISNLSGGIGVTDGTALVENSTFEGNRHGIKASNSEVIVRDSSFTGNGGRRSGGGGIHATNNSTIEVTGSFFRDNLIEEENGGGIYVADSILDIVDSSFGRNEAIGDDDVAYGGGLYGLNSTLSISNATFFGNDASLGGVIAAHGSELIFNNITLDYYYDGNSNGNGIWVHDSKLNIENSSIHSRVSSIINESDVSIRGSNLGHTQVFDSDLSIVGGKIEHSFSVTGSAVRAFNTEFVGLGGDDVPQVILDESNVLFVNTYFRDSLNGWSSWKGPNLATSGGRLELINTSFYSIANNEERVGIYENPLNRTDISIHNSLIFSQVDAVVDTASHNIFLYANASGGVIDGLDNNIVGRNGLLVDSIARVAWSNGSTPSFPVLLLVENSPAVGGGDEALLPRDLLDIDGDNDVSEQIPLDFLGGLRIAGGSLDIGASEFDGWAPPELSFSTTQVEEGISSGHVLGRVSLSPEPSNYTLKLGYYEEIFALGFDFDPYTGIVTWVDYQDFRVDHERYHLLYIPFEYQDHEFNRKFYERFVLEVLDVNESPTDLALDANIISENAANGALIGTFSVADEDEGDSHTYRLRNLADRLAIGASDGQLTVQDSSLLDFETQPSLAIHVDVTDSGGLTYRETFTINVTDANDAPGNLNLDQSVIPFGARSGAAIGTVSASDQDLGDTLTYSIIRDDDSLFEVSASTGELSLRKDTGLIESTFIDVRVTDQLGAFADQRFNFTVEKASGEFSRVNLPARGIQGVTFKGTVSAKLLNDSGRDWHNLSRMDLKLIARPLAGGNDQVLATRDYRGKWQKGKTKSVSLNFSSSLPAGDYRLLVMANYGADTLIAAEDKSGNPQLISVDAGAHIDLTATTELTSKLPASHVDGSRLKVKLKVHVKNDGNIEMPAATTNLHVYLIDSEGARQGGPIATIPALKLSKLKPGQVKAVNVSFDMPGGMPLGTFHFETEIDASHRIAETNEAGDAETNNTSFSTETIQIDEAIIDLAVEIGDKKGERTYTAGRGIRDSRNLRVTNHGNQITAKSALANLRIEIFDDQDRLVFAELIGNIKLGNLKPGKSKNVAARMSLDPLAIGSYRTVYTIEPVNFVDDDLTDNGVEQIFNVS